MAKTRYISGHFSILVGRNFFTSILADILTSDRATSFLDRISKAKFEDLGGYDNKSAIFFFLLAE